ncbi:MAG: aromatic ring-hydroxylating dioxygenase subunit alpha [Rhodospirillaceae bacterium]|nr:aromatic ring-hydroxylating dioxygenase subunit alpha [Rhodospirillaceae bacterium]
MFINFWYPAVASDALKDQPVKVRMLGQHFVVFRDSAGVAHCLSNVCTHRGGNLAGGRIHGDCIACPYHGWRFNGAGECVKIPSLGPVDGVPGGKIPARTRIDAYPVQEKYGLVFAFLGDLPEAERPPILEIKEWGQPGWRTTLQHWVWDIDYKRSIENGIDSAHNEFVHPTHGFSGAREDYQLNEPEMWTDDWGTGIRNKRLAPPLKDEKMREASGRDDNAVVESATGHHGCAQVWTHIHPTPTMFIHQYLFECPIDAGRTSIYLVNMRNFLPTPDHDARMMERNQVVAFQDRDVLVEVEPKITPRTMTKESFVIHDKPIARYRQWLDEWERRGWRIDTDAVEANRANTAYAIPSPGRRQHKAWVMDPVPLLPGAVQKAKAAAE